jgi:NAD(P)-dependent dehydrogenase (short-subunit alcohol dehydrogenase family)
MQNPSPYAAIKAGVVGMSRYIAAVYGKDQIRSNVVCPGGVRDQQPGSFVEKYAERTPMGRMAEPAEVAAVISHLCEPGSKYVSGAVIPVDGGWTAW